MSKEHSTIVINCVGRFTEGNYIGVNFKRDLPYTVTGVSVTGYFANSNHSKHLDIKSFEENIHNHFTRDTLLGIEKGWVLVDADFESFDGLADTEIKEGSVELFNKILTLNKPTVQLVRGEVELSGSEVFTFKYTLKLRRSEISVLGNTLISSEEVREGLELLNEDDDGL